MTSKELIVPHATLKDIIRFFAKVTIDPEISWNNTPCWIWIGAIQQAPKKKPNSGGHGFFYWKGRNHYAYRFTYAWLIEPAPAYPASNLSLDHLCKRPACTNPLHLEKVPIRINILRGSGPTARLAAQTHCKHGHLLPAPDVRGERICKICKNLWAKDWRKARKDEPYSQPSKYRVRYQTDSEFRAKEVQRKRDYDARVPVEIKRERQRRQDERKRAKKRAQP